MFIYFEAEYLLLFLTGEHCENDKASPTIYIT